MADLLGFEKVVKQRQRERGRKVNSKNSKPKAENLTDRIARLQDKALTTIETILDDTEAKSSDRLKAADLVLGISGLKQEEFKTLTSVTNMGLATRDQSQAILEELQVFHRKAISILAEHNQESR